MQAKAIQRALDDIRRDKDPTIKSQKLASLCTALFKEKGVELVVVGGSAIEFYTEGAYLSGDVDLCVLSAKRPLSARIRQEIMSRLGATGGPRNWQVAGLFVDLLGPVESMARTSFRKLKAPYGTVTLMKAEDLLVERVLVSVYPHPNQAARHCAKKLLAVALGGGLAMDWKEVRRLAVSPEYRILSECHQLAQEVADELKINNPLHPA